MQEIGNDPTIRAAIRRLVRLHAAVTTEPTPTGEALLGPFHVHGMVKRIRGKPAGLMLHEVGNLQWLHMRAAEKAGLLHVRSGRSLCCVLARFDLWCVLLRFDLCCVLVRFGV